MIKFFVYSVLQFAASFSFFIFRHGKALSRFDDPRMGAVMYSSYGKSPLNYFLTQHSFSVLFGGLIFAFGVALLQRHKVSFSVLMFVTHFVIISTSVANDIAINFGNTWSVEEIIRAGLLGFV